MSNIHKISRNHFAASNTGVEKDTTHKIEYKHWGKKNYKAKPRYMEFGCVFDRPRTSTILLHDQPMLDLTSYKGAYPFWPTNGGEKHGNLDHIVGTQMGFMKKGQRFRDDTNYKDHFKDPLSVMDKETLKNLNGDQLKQLFKSYSK